MSFRRKKEQIKQEKAWQSFCTDNQGLIQAIGLPPSLYETEEEFGVFLEHGHTHPDDTASFQVSELNPSQYQSLYDLIDKYYEAGYSWTTVSSFVALQKKEVQKLALKYPTQLD